MYGTPARDAGALGEGQSEARRIQRKRAVEDDFRRIAEGFAGPRRRSGQKNGPDDGFRRCAEGPAVPCRRPRQENGSDAGGSDRARAPRRPRGGKRALRQGQRDPVVTFFGPSSIIRSFPVHSQGGTMAEKITP